MITLDDLAVKHGSDKSSLSHGYMEFYKNTLPENPTSIMEIGVLGGASIRIWKEAYPEARIIGVDLFQEYPIPDIEGVDFIAGNQLDHVLLYNIRYNIKPQIIIEDASHNCIDHWVTLYSLMPCCERYYVEDLHTCKEDFYRQGLGFDHTVLGAMLNNKFPFNFELNNEQTIAVIWK